MSIINIINEYYSITIKESKIINKIEYYKRLKIFKKNQASLMKSKIGDIIKIIVQIKYHE